MTIFDIERSAYGLYVYSVGSLLSVTKLTTFPSLNPVLTMRFAVSLKRSADPGGRQEWQLRHFSSISFAASPLHAAQTSTPCEDIEIDQIPPRNNQLQINEP